MRRTDPTLRRDAAFRSDASGRAMQRDAAYRSGASGTPRRLVRNAGYSQSIRCSHGLSPAHGLGPAHRAGPGCSISESCNAYRFLLSPLIGTPHRYILGGCPRIESLLRKSHFGPFLRSFSLNMGNYTQSTRYAHGAGSSPQMIEKMTAKWLSLATTSILGQPPSRRR